MKYVNISSSDTLSTLTSRIGIANVDQILADNGLSRTPLIGQAWERKCKEIKANSQNVDPKKKVSILNQFIPNSDIYELAALSSEETWKVLSAINAFPDYLYISDQMESSIVDSNYILGNNISVTPEMYKAVNESILKNNEIDNDIFGTYSAIGDVSNLQNNTWRDSSAINPMSWFNLPLEEISLYSSLSDTSVAIPAYPESLNDSRSATYTTMPDMLYQYEPWQLYSSSGPRSCTYQFNLHRDMWTGDHRDGKANELIRFCQAQCYPSYNGSAVNTSTVSLYVAGSNLITGILTNVDVSWSGPFSKYDDWYLYFTLSLTITEVSPQALNYDSILSKPLIG